MHKSQIDFIFLSIFIAIIGGVFVISHYNHTKNTFHANLDKQHKNYYTIYETALESTYNNLSLQAKLFADDVKVQDLFLYAKKMIKIEGGTSGGEETAKIRKRLYKLVLEPWNESIKNLDANIFQFHLGPGSLSFLRVHKPNKFGDTMDNLRFIIVDTNKEKTSRQGFETGRISSGLRSIVPIFAWDIQSDKNVYVGALEIGTSYEKLLQTINQHFDVRLDILLNNQHIKQTVWDEFITVNYNKKTISGSNCILESSSQPDQKLLLEHIFKTSQLNKPSEKQIDNKPILLAQTQITQYKEKFYAYQFYPLRDYLGDKDPSRANVGSLFIAKDITDIILAYQSNQFNTIVYSIAAYILIELFLIFTFIKITKNLISQLNKQSTEILDQRRVIDLDKVKYKNLIDTINNNYFFYSRNNNQFSFVSPSIKQVLGYSDTEFLNNTKYYLTNNSQKALFQISDEQTFLEQKKNTFEIDVINKNGRLQYLLITETIKYNLNETKKVVVEGLAQDISQSRQEKMLLTLNCQILQMISDKEEKTKILESLVLGIESIIQDINCSIMLLEHDSGTLTTGAAPHIHKPLLKALNGQKISSEMGSCGIVANTSKRVIIYDIKQSKEFKKLNKMVIDIPYQSCWSEPVLSEKAKVLASFDVYYKNKQKPNESDFAVIAVGIKLVSSLL
ncbi:MAG: hypothetical protein IME94_07440 [Proteobacteria bacterium]|nr:hypothetical protein [Pseudomonadota bacterium]